MRNVILVAALLGLAACNSSTGQLTPQAAAQIASACAADKTLQPVVAASVAASGPSGAAGAVVDTTVVHPIVVAACAAAAASVAQQAQPAVIPAPAAPVTTP